MYIYDWLVIWLIHPTTGTAVKLTLKYSFAWPGGKFMKHFPKDAARKSL
jgi:hypothetical protein